MKDVSSQPATETITPLSTPQKNTGAYRDYHQPRHRFKVLALVGSLILLVIGGGWLLHYLSKNPLQLEEATNSRLPAKTRVEEKTVQRPKEPPPPTEDPARLIMDKENAEQKLAEFLAAKGELDNKGVSEWGGPAYAEMTQLGKQADRHFMDKQYGSASQKYDLATIIAGQLDGRSDEAFRKLLEDGRRALDQGDGSLARRKFTVALMIDATNPSAQRGLERAETIGTVMQLMASGKQHEQNNALSVARTDYRKALEIDPYSKEARQALTQVENLIKEKQFQQLMSEGLAAFHRNDYPLARARLLKAKILKPQLREAADALLQVDQAIRLDGIDRLQAEAQAAERSEDWQRALKSYLAVLNIDKNVQFAARGKERALEQIRIKKRIQFFLTKPDALESDSQLKNAVLLLNEAKEIEPLGTNLTTRIKELEELINIAQTPVKITIESDNLTHVAVYRVGKLGRFSVRELKLRPGTYTVVGNRDGYQDVRQKIVVKPGRQALRITVECRVKI